MEMKTLSIFLVRLSKSSKMFMLILIKADSNIVQVCLKEK